MIGKGSWNTEKDVSTLSKAIIKNGLLYHIVSLVLSQFNYENIENYSYLSQELIEISLLRLGRCVIYKDKKDKEFKIADSFTNNGTKKDNLFNNYYIPSSILINDETYTSNEFVLIKANVLGISELNIIDDDLNRIVDTIYLRDLNKKQNITPIGIPTTNFNKLSRIRLKQQFEDNVGYVLFDVNSMEELEKIKTFSLGVNNIFSELHTQKIKEWNDLLNKLGIKSVNNEKKERLITSEVTQNIEQTELMFYNKFNQRDIGCKKLNDIGCSIKVVRTIGVNYDGVKNELMEEGVENET